MSLGRWWGIHIRLHLFFVLFAALLAYVASVVDIQQFQGTLATPRWTVLVCPLALFVSVVLHEIGHVVVARYLGGVADEVVLSPLGGLAPVRVPYEPHSELVAVMAGTLVNATVCCFCVVVMVLSEGKPVDLSHLLGVSIAFFTPDQNFSLTYAVQLLFWLNWSLILVNLLPVFPFDGGRALHAVLGFLWPELDSKQASMAIIRLGKVVALLLLVLAWYHYQQPTSDMAQPPNWLGLLLLSIYVFFYSRLEELKLAEAEHHDDTVFGYDFSQGYTSFERSLDQSMGREEQVRSTQRKSPVNVFRAWLERRRTRQQERLKEQEIEDERRVDEILDQLHKGGMQSLSSEDRALLERVSKRYRSRPTQ